MLLVRVLSQQTVMECCGSTSSLDYEEDLENVCAILAADSDCPEKSVGSWSQYEMEGEGRISSFG
jgi:hypothetical protein